VALNTAFFEDGAFIEDPKGVVLQKPLHILQISHGGGHPTVSHPRNLILVGDTGQASIIETFVSLEEDTTFTNTVTEIVAGEGALVDYSKVQQESDAALPLRARAGAPGTLVQRGDALHSNWAAS
jgi:Fe-S cluster assembly protein SufD